MISKKTICKGVITGVFLLSLSGRTFGNWLTAPTADPVKPQAKKENPSIARELTINEIKIKTKNKKLEKSLKKYLAEYKNQIFSNTVSEEIHNKILVFLKDRKFLLPNLTGPLFDFSGNTLNISYEIKEPYRYGFVVKGNTALSGYKILSTANYEKYFNNSQLIRRMLSRIKELYLRTGYSNVRLKHKMTTDPKAFIKTVFILVKENKRTKIKQIKLFGRFSRPAGRYMDIIYDYGGPLLRRKIFYSEGIQTGLKNLVNSLKNEGYFSAAAHTRITNTTDNNVIIDVILNEGPLTVVKDIHFKGNRYFSRQKLLNLMKIKIGKGLNINYLERDIEALTEAYKAEGFMEMELPDKEQTVKYNKETSSAVLRFNIKENTKIKIGEIIIEGNNLTKKDFIMNSLSLKKGDTLTPEKMEYSLKKLRALSIFSAINILIEEKNKKQQDRTLIVQVEERKPKFVRFGLGANTERALTARGFAEFSNRNITGRGRHFFSNIKLQSNIAKYMQIDSTAPEYLEHQLSLSYVEPFLLGSGFSGQVNVSNSTQVFSHRYTLPEGGITDIVNSTKINFLLKSAINDFTRLTWTLLSWEDRTEFEKSERCRTNRHLFCDSDTLNISTTGLALNIDKRDNILSTSSGFLSQLFVEYSGPFYIVPSSDNVQFIKMEVKHFDFRPVLTGWVWANSVQGGFIANMNNLQEGGVPVSKTFILGGANSLRGFDGLINGERVPDKQEFPIEHANQLIFSRSSFYLLLKTELRFAVSKSFTGSVFYDGGFVAVSGNKFELPYRHSAGFGLNYKTPLGPVSGYIAFKISPKPGESAVVPHLSFGSF